MPNPFPCLPPACPAACGRFDRLHKHEMPSHMAQLTDGPARLSADALVGYGAPMRLAKPLATLGALYLELLELIEQANALPAAAAELGDGLRGKVGCGGLEKSESAHARDRRRARTAPLISWRSQPSRGAARAGFRERTPE